MSEEATNPENDGTWTGLKKTIIGTLTTLIAGGGTWVGVTLFGGGSEEKSEEKTEQVAPAPAAQPVINLNVDNSSQNNSSNSAKSGGTTTIIKEKPIEKAPEKKSESEDAPW